MKKFMIIMVVMSIFMTIITCDITLAQQKRVVLQGGVSTSVPRTPSEVKEYLVKMNAIMKEYDALSQQLLLVLMTGTRSPAVADTARSEWIRLANKIDKIVPPTELKISHAALAEALRNSNSFLTSWGNVDASQKNQILTAMVPVVTQLGSATNLYSQSCAQVINSYGLDPSLNPLSPQGAIGGGTGGLGGLGGLGALGGLGGIDLNNINVDGLK
ncbi:MAG: hypothetical protein AB1782_03210 [Cyanobacteriota bacterium]